MIKILQNGVKWDGGYTPCFYSMGNTCNHSDKCITIYARDYKHLPAGLGAIENDTDTQTDYFDEDKVCLEPSDKYYKEALIAYNKRTLADAKRYLKHDEKRLQKELDSGHPYPSTVSNLKASIENYKRIIATLSK